MMLGEFLTCLVGECIEEEIIVVGRQGNVLELEDTVGHLLLLFDIALILDGSLHVLHHVGGEGRDGGGDLGGKLSEVAERKLRTQQKAGETHLLIKERRAMLLKPSIDIGGHHGRCLDEPAQLTGLPYPLLHTAHAGIIGQPDGMAKRSEALVGIVLPEEDAVFGTRGEHTVGLVDTLGDEVVNQHTDIRLRTREDKRRLALELQRGIDASHKALAGGLFVAGGAIDLAGKVETFNTLGLKGVGELGGREVVVLDGIAGLKDTGLGEAVDGTQGVELHIEGKRRREAIDIVGLRVPPFGLDEKLVVVLVGEAVDLILDGGAIARPTALDATCEHGRALETGAENVVGTEVGIGNIAGALLGKWLGISERELGRMLVARLDLQAVEVDGAAVDAYRRAGLEALHLESEAAQLVGKPGGRGLPYPTALPRIGADIDGAVEEGATGEHHGAAGDGVSHAGAHAADGIAVELEGYDLVLPKGKSRDILQHLAPIQREEHAVALGAWAPHGRALGEVEHAELDGRAVGDDAAPAAEGVDFAHNLPLGHATHGWVAGHLADGIEHLGDEQHTTPQLGSCSRSLSAGMSTAHNHYIERLKLHRPW